MQPTTPPPPVAEGEVNYQLVKVHGVWSLLLFAMYEFTLLYVVVGAMMIAAWGLLAPVGILMAIFYKVVWPSGEWFYVSHDIVTI